MWLPVCLCGYVKLQETQKYVLDPRGHMSLWLLYSCVTKQKG